MDIPNRTQVEKVVCIFNGSPQFKFRLGQKLENKNGEGEND